MRSTVSYKALARRRDTAASWPRSSSACSSQMTLSRRNLPNHRRVGRRSATGRSLPRSAPAPRLTPARDGGRRPRAVRPDSTPLAPHVRESHPGELSRADQREGAGAPRPRDPSECPHAWPWPPIHRTATAAYLRIVMTFPISREAGQLLLGGARSGGRPSCRSWITSTTAGSPDSSDRSMAGTRSPARSTRSPWAPSRRA
jgi:hypothetical protein